MQQRWRIGCRGAAGLAVVLVLAACQPHPVGPARTLDDYEAKARTTAGSAASVVATVQLAAETSSAGGAFGPYLSELVSEQEDLLDGVTGTFASIQPSGAAADAVREELLGILDAALDHVTEVRLAVRRGELDALDEVAEPLDGDAAALQRFEEEHA